MRREAQVRVETARKLRVCSVVLDCTASITSDGFVMALVSRALLSKRDE